MSDDLKQLTELFDRLSEGSLSEAEAAALCQRLVEDSEATRFYIEYMSMVASLKWHYEAGSSALPLPLATETAALAMPRQPARRPSAALRRPASKSDRRMWMAFAASFLLAATCIFGMLAYLDSWWSRMREPNPIWTGGGKIVEVMRIEQVEWPSDQPTISESMELGSDSIRLKSGWIELAFFGGSRLILEGPAHLDMRTSSSAYLHYGKAVVHVDRGDFRLDGAGLRIIDLGTEFALDLEEKGNGEVHVFEGSIEAALLDNDGRQKQSIRLKKDQAVRLKSDREDFQAIAANSDRFLRHLPARPIQLELADIIAGGNGLGSGTRAGIDPANGRLDTGAGHGYKNGDYTYHPVILSPYIDGVFIPDGRNGPVQIDSAGHTHALPATSNQAYDLIRQGGTQDEVHTIRNEGWKVQDPFSETNLKPVLDGIDYRSAGQSLIGIHANAGITFDLQALREAYPEHRILRFEAVAGNVGRKGDGRGLTDAWVFVDGKLMFNHNKITADEKGHRIQFSLSPDARFLTLISTDGGNGIGLDWAVLGNARLQLEPLATKQLNGAKP